MNVVDAYKNIIDEITAIKYMIWIFINANLYLGDPTAFS